MLLVEGMIIKKMKRDSYCKLVLFKISFDALIIGMAQALALIPGTSRSGIVYSGGRFLNISRVEALRFAMLLSIPTILLSAFIPTYKFIESPSSEFLLMGTVGLIVSFATAYLSISLLMNWVRNFSMVPFVVYRIILGSILLVYSSLNNHWM